MIRRKGLLGGALIILMVAALWSSSLVTGAPARQANSTDQAATDFAAFATSMNFALSQPAKFAETLTQAAEDSASYNRFQLEQTLRAPVATALADELFTAYFLNVAGNTGEQMSLLKNLLTVSYDWQVRTLSPAKLNSIGGDNRQSTVIVIPGGSTALDAKTLAALQAYVAAGGGLVVLAGSNLNDTQTSLATADDFSAWLYDDFGVGFNSDVVIDQTQAFQTPLDPIATELDRVSFITTNGIPVSQSAVVFTAPNSIRIADSLPENVEVTALIYSTADAYAKTNLQAVINSELAQTEEDMPGPLVLAASAENLQTGARIVLIGSDAVGGDDLALLQGADDFSIMLNSLAWTTRFDSYARQLSTSIAQTVDPLVDQALSQTANVQAARETRIAQGVRTAQQISYITATAMAR